MTENTPYPPPSSAAPYPPAGDTPYPPATDAPYPPATDAPYPPAAAPVTSGLPYPTGPSDGSNPPTTTPYPPAGDILNPPAPAADQTKANIDAQPPPYSPPTGGYPPPSMMAYPPPPQPGYPPAVYQTAPPQNPAIIRSTQHGPQTTVTTTQVMVGFDQCPKCRVGVLQETFTPAGICCAIFLFPIGLLFCLMMRRKICTHCGAIYM